MFTTMPVFACYTGPRHPCFRPRRRILVRYVIGTPILVLVLSLILALILALVLALILALILTLALCWSTTPTPTSGLHHVFAFTVSCICIHGLSCLLVFKGLVRSGLLRFLEGNWTTTGCQLVTKPGNCNWTARDRSFPVFLQL
jgi:hypothetical protein